MRVIRHFLVLIAGLAVFALATVPQIGLLFTDRFIAEQDFAQEYVLARAIRDRTDPYVPLEQLGSRYLELSHSAREGAAFAANPTPHPPTAGLLTLPLSFLSYPEAAWMWLGIQLLSLYLAVLALGRLAGIPLGPLSAAGFAAGLTILRPVESDLRIGNLMLPILAALSWSAVLLFQARASSAGACLALAVLLKPLAWPIVLLLVVRKRWRALVSCLIVLTAGALASTIAIGPTGIVSYALRVLPSVVTYYRVGHGNLSPLANSGANGLAAVGVALALILIAALTAARFGPLEAGYAVMVLAALVVSPLLWDYDLVLLAIPLALVAPRIVRQVAGSGPGSSAPRLVARYWSPFSSRNQ